MSAVDAFVCEYLNGKKTRVKIKNYSVNQRRIAVQKAF